MRVKREYIVSRYGDFNAQALEGLSRAKKAQTIEDLKVLYKRASSWITKDMITDEDKQDIDRFINDIYILFKKEYPTFIIEKFRIERKDKSKPYMTRDNIVFVQKGGRR